MTNPGTLPDTSTLKMELRELVTKITTIIIDSPPDTWLLCDGSSYDAKDYPELAAVINQTHIPTSSKLPGPWDHSMNHAIYIKARPAPDLRGFQVGQLADGSRIGTPPKCRKFI